MNNLRTLPSDKTQPDVPELQEQLLAGIHQLHITLPDVAVAQLLQYLRLLVKWNFAYNLTAVRDPAEMVTRHLLDSLAIMPYVQGSHCADIGTGAGLPGIPLAIAFPQKQFELIDSNGKKIRFVTQAIAELGLRNVNAIQCRIESWQPAHAYDTVLSRAFATLADMTGASAHLLAEQGVMLAMKGIYPEQELSALPKHFKVDACHPLQIPGEVGQRHLVEIRCRD